MFTTLLLKNKLKKFTHWSWQDRVVFYSSAKIENKEEIAKIIEKYIKTVQNSK